VEVRVLGQTLVKRRLDFQFADAIASLITVKEPDVVHTHMFASTTAATVALEDFPAPLVVHEHSEATWRDRLARQQAAHCYRHAAAIVAVSRSIRERLIGLDGVPANKVHLLPNTLATLPGGHGGAGSELPPRGERRVGLVSRLQPEKGGMVFLRAAAQVLRHVPDVTFIVIGDGPERPAMEHLAADLHLPVQFLGFRPDGPELIAQLDLLVVPSFSEGTPLVVLEAAAAKVPIVACAVGGIPEQVRSGLEALLVPPGNPTAVAQACQRILLEPALRTRLVTAAHRRLSLRSARAAVDVLDNLYGSVLPAPPVPAGA
jgi:glycosyltransferase involved in cell wall biosynthesis